MPKFYDCEQRSAEWFNIHVGRITASRIIDVLNYRKDGKEGADRVNYRAELVAERLSGSITPHYVNDAMRWGIEQEPIARAVYESERNVLVIPMGFVEPDGMSFTGASPDGFIGNDGILEIKCPNTTTHLGWIHTGICPPEYEPQVMWNMFCAQRLWGDFISFDPRLPDDLRSFIVRVPYSEERVQQLKDAVIKFNAEVESDIVSLRRNRKNSFREETHIQRSNDGKNPD